MKTNKGGGVVTRRERKLRREAWPEGSFGYYMYRGGDFVRCVAEAIQRADPGNRWRLARAFPQMVAAFELGGDWTGVPKGFAPRYDAHRKRAARPAKALPAGEE